jgi:acetoacetyl-CoA reductase/3-oxoacyl-[acyl-carrier protein] reductase
VALNYRSGEAKARAVAEEILALGQGRMRERGSTSDSAADPYMLAQANVGDTDEARALVKRVVERWGRLDILINNAGITRDRSLRKMTDEDWLDVINTNLNSVFYCTSAAMPIMVEQRYGRIINISSMNGQTSAFGQANYAASKGGIIAFTKTAAAELARYGVTVNTVAPGFTETDMFAAVPDELQTQIKGRIPMGRFAEPEEIAEAVVFLACGGAYITGQQINVNGGAYV